MSITSKDVATFACRIYGTMIRNFNGLDSELYEARQDLEYAFGKSLPENWAAESIEFDKDQVKVFLQKKEKYNNYYAVNQLWTGDFEIVDMGAGVDAPKFAELGFNNLFNLQTALLLRWYAAIENETYRQIDRSFIKDKPVNTDVLKTLTNPQWGLHDLVINLVFSEVDFTESTIKGVLA